MKMFKIQFFKILFLKAYLLDMICELKFNKKIKFIIFGPIFELIHWNIFYHYWSIS